MVTGHAGAGVEVDVVAAGGSVLAGVRIALVDVRLALIACNGQNKCYERASACNRCDRQVPSYPAKQTHSYWSSWLWQVAPCSHGDDRHSLTSFSHKYPATARKTYKTWTPLSDWRRTCPHGGTRAREAVFEVVAGSAVLTRTRGALVHVRVAVRPCLQ